MNISTRRTRVYELHGRFGRYTRTRCESQDVVHVAAKSIKQAYWLANNNRWRQYTDEVGIVSKSDGQRWLHEDGSVTDRPRYRHGGTARRVS